MGNDLEGIFNREIRQIHEKMGKHLTTKITESAKKNAFLRPVSMRSLCYHPSESRISAKIVRGMCVRGTGRRVCRLFL
jgi:hypothetical protein